MAKNLLENAGHGSLGNKIFNVLRDKILNEEYVQGQFTIFYEKLIMKLLYQRNLIFLEHLFERL